MINIVDPNANVDTGPETIDPDVNVDTGPETVDPNANVDTGPETIDPNADAGDLDSPEAFQAGTPKTAAQRQH